MVVVFAKESHCNCSQWLSDQTLLYWIRGEQMWFWESSGFEPWGNVKLIGKIKSFRLLLQKEESLWWEIELYIRRHHHWSLSRLGLSYMSWVL